MPYIAPEVITEAKRMDLLTYLREYEPGELVKFSSNTYTTRTHDSLKISNGKWMWWSRGIGGKSALDYLIKVRGMDFVEAVQTIMGNGSVSFPTCENIKSYEEQPLLLPEKSPTADVVFDYLFGRGIDYEIINYCLEQKLIIESLPYHNAVFVGRDEKGQARYAFLRGIYDRGKPFKMEQSGSDKAYSFCVPPSGKCCRVAVYEAAIETIAHMTLEGNRTDKYRLSVGGIYAPKDGRRKREEKPPLALEHFLENHPEVTQIEICTNNDGPGRYACETMKRTYRDRYEILINLPEREGTDYADQRKHGKRKKKIEWKGRSLYGTKTIFIITITGRIL